MAVDNLLDELAFRFGCRGVIVVQRGTEAAVGFEFVFLEDHAVAGKAVLEGVHGGSFSAFRIGLGLGVGQV